MDDIFVPVTEIGSLDFNQRLVDLNEHFKVEYGADPEFFVKVPGRVNLIGEHIDYCGYPVLPMAIEQSIFLAVGRSGDDLVHLRNLESKYENFKCNVNTFKIDLPTCGGPAWYSYFLCGVKGIFDFVGGDVRRHGFFVSVSGNIPPASGLSSSSALVSAATLATAFIHGLKLPSQKLASIAAVCERYIGTQGGGMDQAIAFLAQPGCAQLIHFDPLKAEPIRLPMHSIFVVANSLAEMNKAATSDFNERVVECRISCHLLAKKLGVEGWRQLSRLRELQNNLGCDLNELESLASQNINKDVYTRHEVLTELEITDQELSKNFLTPNTQAMQLFKLRQRTMHVIQESKRVWKFRTEAESDNSSLERLSELMRQSHTSLRNLYECSHPCLDKLVEISQNLNIGARLTGAGWGGSIVALCDSLDSCNKYIQVLKEKYYKDLPQAKGRNLDNVVFATYPCGGAEVFYHKQTN
uniref:Putative galactokinase n=1 Tax=Tabanus bromius TaxID=304241 RepID=A0A0K8TKS2_TABBR